MPPTTAAELRDIYARTLSSTGVDPEVLDTRLWDCDLEVVPRVIGDERHWRASIDGAAEARLLDAEELLRELAFLLLRYPDAPIALRTADPEEVAAYLLLDGEGLTGVDERRQRATAAAEQLDQEPVDGGPPTRPTLQDLARELETISVRLRELAIAAERPAVPVELQATCQDLELYARSLQAAGERLAETHQIITERRPMRTTFTDGQPWGAAALGLPRRSGEYAASTVLTDRQIRHLAQELPWRPPPSLPYLDGLGGLPGLEVWESARAVHRRAEARAVLILQAALRRRCRTCAAEPGEPCRTAKGGVASVIHRPREAAGKAAVDQKAAELAAAEPSQGVVPSTSEEQQA